MRDENIRVVSRNLVMRGNPVPSSTHPQLLRGQSILAQERPWYTSQQAGVQLLRYLLSCVCFLTGKPGRTQLACGGAIIARIDKSICCVYAGLLSLVASPLGFPVQLREIVIVGKQIPGYKTTIFLAMLDYPVDR